MTGADAGAGVAILSDPAWLRRGAPSLAGHLRCGRGRPEPVRTGASAPARMVRGATFTAVALMTFSLVSHPVRG